MTERELDLSEEGRARRRFLKQAGTVAWATPFLVTMMSRGAAAHHNVCGTAQPAPPPYFVTCGQSDPCGSGFYCSPQSPDWAPGDPCHCTEIPA